MKTLHDSLTEFAKDYGYEKHNLYAVCPMIYSFYAGAAAMAEQFAAGQGPLLEQIRLLCSQLAVESDALRRQIKDSGCQISNSVL